MPNDNSKQLELARNFLNSYKGELIASLPTHLKEKGAGWMTAAYGALRRDNYLLNIASENPSSLIVALSSAAQLGLMPGTEEFWLTARGGRNPAVLGIVGYVGYVELIYRAGAVSSVIVEAVHENDGFEWNPGIMDKPRHTVNWFGGGRGRLIGAYAYAVMKDGATSKVAIVDHERANRAMEASPTASKDGLSPWRTDPKKMWLKTAARDLAKWVPTSSEYREALNRLEQEDVVEQAPTVQRPAPEPEHSPDVDQGTGEVLQDMGEAEEYDPTMEPGWTNPETVVN